MRKLTVGCSSVVEQLVKGSYDPDSDMSEVRILPTIPTPVT